MTSLDAVTACEATEMVDNFLTIIGNIRDEKPRDPLRRLEDVLLDLRAKVTEAEVP